MDFLEGVFDPRLKPRLLRSLVRDRLPDDARPLQSPAELASVLTAVKTHGLLAERLLPGDPYASDAQLMETWRSAVDAWVDRVLSLASSQMPDKCWAGLCLLGVTCEECSSERFNASYSLWFQKLLSNIQQQSSSVFTKAASCTSLADFFIRLAGCSNARKDATTYAGKVIQPIILFLNEDGSEAVQEGAADLLKTLITFFPSSLHGHYNNVEAVLLSKIIAARGNGHLSKKIACCLSLVPKIKGDEESWSSTMRRLIMEIDTILNDVFHGLEKETKHPKRSRLFLSGNDPPLGLLSRLEETSEHPMKRLRELTVPVVSILIQCCSIMLTNPYPVQVNAPVQDLVTLVGRILNVDGSLPKSSMALVTSLQQELLCHELPVLHSECLDLLISIIKGVRSQLLPHAANIVRILTEYFRRAVLPSIRIKMYTVMQDLLISMGVGMALYLAQEIINNAFADLNDTNGSSSVFQNQILSKVVSQKLFQGSQKKRKHSNSSLQHANGIDPETVAVNIKAVSPLSVKIAALKALEALLTVGGSLRSECWRSDVDSLAINVARNACDVGWAHEAFYLSGKEDSTSSRSDFQLASLKVLLASLLSTSHVRPPHLSEGLELFRRGKLESGTELAAFCSHALFTLEVLIHPRALPLVDFSAAKTSGEGFGIRDSVTVFHNHQKSQLAKVTEARLGITNNMDDEDMYCGWLDAGEEEQPLHGPMDHTVPENQARADPDRGHQIVQSTQEEQGNLDVEMTTAVKEAHLVGSSNVEEPNLSVARDGNRISARDGIAADTLSVDVMAPEKNGPNTFGSTAESSSSGKIATHGLVVENLTAHADDTFKSLCVSDKEKRSVTPNHSDSDSDIIARIEFKDLDSDSE